MTPPQTAAALDASPLRDISREELRRRLNDPQLSIVDALPRESYAGEHLPGAINLPVAEVRDNARKLLPDPAAEIALYCAKFT
jgi:rhodanese-related sulfurtransferase